MMFSGLVGFLSAQQKPVIVITPSDANTQIIFAKGENEGKFIGQQTPGYLDYNRHGNNADAHSELRKTSSAKHYSHCG
jgi:hypothetical protein